MIDKIKTCIFILNRANNIDYIQEHYVFDDPKIDNIVQFAKDVELRETYIPKKNDKMWFMPDCTIPRFKMKQFCEGFGTSIVKYKDKADIIFMNRKSITNYVHSVYYCSYYSKDDVLKFLTTSSSDYSNGELVEAIRKSTSNFVSIQSGIEFKKKLVEVEDDMHPAIKFYNKESCETFVSLMTADNIYEQSALLKHINTGTVMNKENYISIQRLLKSSDTENIKSAMEIMANCDYEKSCVYLLLLIADFKNEIFNSKTRNHVNFKALLNFFSITNKYEFNIYDILNALIDTKCLNQTNLDKLEDRIKTSLLLQNDFYTVGTLLPTDRILKAVSDNILDKELDTEVINDDPEYPLQALSQTDSQV